MSAARGAISLLEKSCTVSRMASAVSPRSKLNIRCALGIMVGLPPGKFAACLAHRLMRWPQACHGPMALRRGWPPALGPRSSRKAAKLSLAPAHATGCNSLNNRPPEPTAEGNTRRRPMHGTIDAAEESRQAAARDRAYSIPLAEFDVGDPELFKTDSFWPYFDRLRKEDPVHYCKDSVFGPYWSVTKYNDIMDVETNHAAFSSAASLGGITIRDAPPDLRRESFIAMDQPRHSAQRKTVAPMFTPTHLDQLAINIRKRSAECLDNLPRNEVFDWVDQVSIELTTQMLAVLFDFPWEDRRKLTRWSDVATTIPGPDGVVATEDGRQAELLECAAYFGKHWKERIKQPPKSDRLSMMAHSEATRDMDPKNFLGNLILLIVGGNDTTRNTLSGSIYALSKNPDQYRKL